MMEKVIINNNHPKTYECSRCNQWYCMDCDTSVEVDFRIIEKETGVDWKGKWEWINQDVCPYCYNQLIDLKLKQDVKKGLSEVKDEN